MSPQRTWRALAPAVALLLALGCGGGDSVFESPTQPAPPDIDVDALETCAQIGDAMQLELGFIQRCILAAECGQALQGTSCGCTRDLVARLDADTRRFYRILERGQAMECAETVFITPCDCPAADGFACGAGRTCTWNYLPQ